MVKVPSAPPLAVTVEGQEVHARTLDHMPAGNRITVFNKWLAVKITDAVGSMWAAYAFACLALISLPSAVKSHSIIIIVSWIAQTFLQLVLLAIIIVGQEVQSAASDVRAKKTFEDVERIIDLLRLETVGGLADLYEKLHAENQELRSEVQALREGRPRAV